MSQRRYDDKSKKRGVERLLEYVPFSHLFTLCINALRRDKANGKGPASKPVREDDKKGKKKRAAASSEEESSDSDSKTSKKKKTASQPAKKKKKCMYIYREAWEMTKF